MMAGERQAEADEDEAAGLRQYGSCALVSRPSASLRPGVSFGEEPVVDRTFAGPGSGGIFLDIRLVVGDARLGRFPSRIAGVLSFTVIVLTGLVCGTVPSLSAFPPGLVGSNVATVPPIAVRCITIDSDISGPFLFLLTSLVGINFYYCRTTYGMLRETISLRLENESLVDHLEQERDRAQMAERAKTRFLAAASHDLRQPIHA